MKIGSVELCLQDIFELINEAIFWSI